MISLSAIIDPVRRAPVRRRVEETGRIVIDLSAAQVAEFAGNTIELTGRDGRLLALILTGAIPIFLTPTRNQVGIIGPIPRREFDSASIRAKIEANPFVRDKTATPRLLTPDPEHLRRDVAAAMMERPGGTALVEESLTEALEFRRAMIKIAEEMPGTWWFSVWGPDTPARHGLGERRDWDLHHADSWHGFSDVEPGFTMLDPIKATILTPGLDVAESVLTF